MHSANSIIPASQIQTVFHAFEPDSTYYNYCEFAKNPNRESSERRTQEQDKTKHLSKNNGITDYKLIPNPNNGIFSLYCPVDSNVKLVVYDSKGQIVLQQFTKPNKSVISFDISSSANGMYQILISGPMGISTLRFIISH